METDLRFDDELVLSGRDTLRIEAKALFAFVDTLDHTFAQACRSIFECRGTVLVTGVGKSGLVGRKWASTFSGTGTKAYFVNSADAPHGDLGVFRPEDLLIVLSLSGETEELSHVLRHAHECGMRTIGVTGSSKSSLARQTNIILLVQPSQEACPLGLAPTTSTTLLMALGDALAVALMKMRGFTERDFARLHPGGTLGRKLWLRVSEIMHQGDAMPVVDPDAPLDEVLLEMTSKCLGLAVVTNNDEVAGVITDGDLRRFLKKGSSLVGATARDVMTVEPKLLGSDALAVEAREKMQKHSIQQLLIVDENNKLAGVLHLYDLMRAKVF